MGKGGKVKIPAAPDPQKLIAQQAQVNRINQTTPFGSVTFGGPNRSDATLNLSPRFQALLDAQSDFGTAAAQAGGRFLGASSLTPAAPQNVDQIAQAMFDLGAGRAMPIFNQQEAQLINALENSGNPAVGAALSPGAVSERDLFNRSRNQFLSDLSLNAITQATGQRGQLLQQDLAANQGNAQVAALLANSSPVQAPTLQDFYPPGTIDVMGPFNLQQQNALARAQIKSQQNSSFLGGLFDLGGAAIGAFGGGGFSNPFSMFGGGGGSALTSLRPFFNYGTR